MLALGEAQIRDYIKTIGLYRNKAKNVIALCQMLISDFNSEIPKTRDELVRLPGVGRKTANVVLNIAFGQPTMAVDTHIFRLGNRTGMAPGKNVEEVEKKLVKTHPRGLAAVCSSLANPTRTLCLQGKKARMLEMHCRRPLPF